MTAGNVDHQRTLEDLVHAHGTYVFNPDERRPTFVVAVGIPGKPWPVARADSMEAAKAEQGGCARFDS